MMTKTQLKQIQIIVLVIASLAYLGMRHVPASKGAAPGRVQESVEYVSRVVDGDTLALSGGEKVRLTGIDTPEVHHSDKLVRDAMKVGRDIREIQELGRRASDFTKKLCGGKKIRLEYDVVKRDRYGRLLAYVYLEDGTFVNAKIIEEGYAQVLTIPPNVRYAERFLRLQREAREKRRGLWAVPGGM